MDGDDFFVYNGHSGPLLPGDDLPSDEPPALPGNVTD